MNKLMKLVLTSILVVANGASANPEPRYTVQSFIDQNASILEDGELAGAEYSKLSSDLLSCLKNEHSKVSQRTLLNPQSYAIILKIISESKQTSNYNIYEDYYRTEFANCFPSMDSSCFKLSPNIENILEHCDLLLSDEDAANLLANAAAAAMNNEPKKLKKLLMESRNILTQEFKDNLLFSVIYSNRASVEVVEVLIDSGSNVNSSYRPLSSATWSRDIFELLLKKGANPNFETARYASGAGLHPFILDISHSHPHLTSLMISYGADAKDILNWSEVWDDEYSRPAPEAILVAIRNLNWDIDNFPQRPIANALCSNPLYIDEANKNGYDFLKPIKVSHIFGDTQIHSSNIGSNSIVPAYFACKPEMLKSLLEHSPQINFNEVASGNRFVDSAPYFHFWEVNNEKTIELMLSSGWDINRRYRHDTGHLSSLMRAAFYFNKNSEVSVLQKHGANINITDDIWTNYPAKIYSSDYKYFVELGFNPNVKDQNGNTPILRLAELLNQSNRWDYTDTVDKLKALFSKNNVDCEVRNNIGENVFDILKKRTQHLGGYAYNKDPFKKDFMKILKMNCSNH
jgi:ankyrin repeat protein